MSPHQHWINKLIRHLKAHPDKYDQTTFQPNGNCGCLAFHALKTDRSQSTIFENGRLRLGFMLGFGHTDSTKITACRWPISNRVHARAPSLEEAIATLEYIRDGNTLDEAWARVRYHG